MWIGLVLVIFMLEIGARANTNSKDLPWNIARFSVKFCNELNKTRSVVSSPLSAELVLALLTLATTEPAHSELLTSLGISNDDAIRSSFSTVSTKLRSLKKVTLNIANKLYIQDGSYKINPRVMVDAESVFNIAVDKIDFNDSVVATKKINSWVENHTNHKIKNLVSSDSVDSNTRLMLINAIYFKGKWKHEFNTSETMDQDFFLNANSTIQVPMMFKEVEYPFGFSERLQAQLLTIPYADDEASMLIVVPEEIDGLDKVLAKLMAGDDLITEIEKMVITQVQVNIPKFRIETEIDLKELLPKFGINSIFNSDPGFIKLINNDEPIFVSKAVQKAFIEVNEEGAEAAAATGTDLILRRALPEFRADRPFLYLLLGADRTPIFIGTYRGIT